MELPFCFFPSEYKAGKENMPLKKPDGSIGRSPSAREESLDNKGGLSYIETASNITPFSGSFSNHFDCFSRAAGEDIPS
jgi:hypothetical protein